MRKFKKIMALLLATALTISIFSITIAADTPPRKENQTQATAEGIFPLNIDSVNACAIQNNITVVFSLKAECKQYQQFGLDIIDTDNRQLVYTNAHDKNDIVSISTLNSVSTFSVSVSLSNQDESVTFIGLLHFNNTGGQLSGAVTEVKRVENNQTQAGGANGGISTLSGYPAFYETEPNGMMVQANEMSPDTSVYAYMSKSDTDWYKFVNKNKRNIQINLSVGSCADYDVYAYRAQGGTKVGESRRGTGQTEWFEFVAEPNETYYIKVEYYSGDAGNYVMDATFSVVRPEQNIIY